MYRVSCILHPASALLDEAGEAFEGEGDVEGGGGRLGARGWRGRRRAVLACGSGFGRRKRGFGRRFRNKGVKMVERGRIVGAGMGEGAGTFSGFGDVRDAGDDLHATDGTAAVRTAHKETGVEVLAGAEEMIDNGRAVREMAEGVFDDDAFVVGDAFGGTDAADESVERGAVSEHMPQDRIGVEFSVGVDRDGSGGGVGVARMWRRLEMVIGMSGRRGGIRRKVEGIEKAFDDGGRSRLERHECSGLIIEWFA